jgi:hypothetical protein
MKHGTWLFRLKYGWSWLVELFRNLSFNEAYFQNRFEREARAVQQRVYCDLCDRIQENGQESAERDTE